MIKVTFNETSNPLLNCVHVYKAANKKSMKDE